MPYQEEPRDTPVQFAIEPGAGTFVPIVIAGSVTGVADARATYERVLGRVPDLLRHNVEHYQRLVTGTLDVETPDDRVNAAFRWAKVGVDKGVAANPLLGTGLVAGFRTSGDSERPGFCLVLRARRDLDDVRGQRLRRLRHHAAGARVPSRLRARRRQDPARDLAERVAHSLVHEVRLPVGQRRRNAAVHCGPRGLLARIRRRRLHPRGLALHREGIPVFRGNRHGWQRPDREHRRRARLGRGRRALSATRGNLPAGHLDRRTRGTARARVRGHGRRRHGRRRRAAARAREAERPSRPTGWATAMRTPTPRSCRAPTACVPSRVPPSNAARHDSTRSAAHGSTMNEPC